MQLCMHVGVGAFMHACVSMFTFNSNKQFPATQNRTRDHLIVAAFYSQMLYQLSYSRLEVDIKYFFTVPSRRHITQSAVSRHRAFVYACIYGGMYVCMYLCMFPCACVCMHEDCHLKVLKFNPLLQNQSLRNSM